ncbi:MAG: hypothetical protein H7222_07375 [Methylotenera sp.]|nr:hypothetical protein [Oligoflexia bacterium]
MKPQIEQDVNAHVHLFTSVWSWMWVGFVLGIGMSVWVKHHADAPAVIRAMVPETPRAPAAEVQKP